MPKTRSGFPQPRLGLHASFLAASLALAPACVATLAMAAPPSGDSGGYDVATRGELQGVITKQLDAFDKEDAKTAESFATPSLREKYPDPAGFFDMVKQNYAPLVKPRSTHFEETSDSPHGPLQKMTVVAQDGTVWTVVYAFERVSGEWRISGCGMMKQDSQDI